MATSNRSKAKAEVKKVEVGIRITDGSVTVGKKTYTSEDGVFTLDEDVRESVLNSMDGAGTVKYEKVELDENLVSKPGAIK